LDVLVNNAGVGAGGASVADLDDAQIDTVLRTDLLGPLYCCAHSSGCAAKRAAVGAS
jgi:glucose 1-dehydrogenase